MKAQTFTADRLRWTGGFILGLLITALGFILAALL